MRMSREAMAQHHQEIVTAGARLLRERGIEGLSVADLMQAAGLTHGGFYRHFASKDAFVREAIAAAFASIEEMRNGWRGTPMEQLITCTEQYLSEMHVAQPGMGCPTAAFAGEMVRASEETQTVFMDGFLGITDWIAKRLEGDEKHRRERAAQIMTTMVGAVIAARASGNSEGGVQILEAARVQVRSMLA